jgi:hypothetical protein
MLENMARFVRGKFVKEKRVVTIKFEFKYRKLFNLVVEKYCDDSENKNKKKNKKF